METPDERNHLPDAHEEDVDLVFRDVNPRLLLSYKALLAPKLIELGGSVFIGLIPKLMLERVESCICDKTLGITEIEKQFNFFEVPYLFGISHRGSDDASDWDIARIIAECWKSHLLAAFPTRRFQVELIPPEESGSVVALQVYEVR